jgi:hypothetical protein
MVYDSVLKLDTRLSDLEDLKLDVVIYRIDRIEERQKEWSEKLWKLNLTLWGAMLVMILSLLQLYFNMKGIPLKP